MNPSRFAFGLVGFALAGLWYLAGGAEPLPASHAAEGPHVAAPLAHENLSVYFIYGTDAVPDAKVLSLGEALERKVAVVHETSNVNVLAIENRSPDCELFVQSGDIVKGGKQDRMAATDMLLPPMSGVVAMKAHCVEQGRWTGRGAEDSRQFNSSHKYAVGNEMKIANYSGQQPAVWQSVSANQISLSANVGATVNAPASPTSFQLTLETAALEAKVAEYEAALRAAANRDGVVGVVFAVNGQVTGAEVYGSCALFRKAWPKLLNAAASEAVGKRDKPAAAPPAAHEIERFLADATTAEPAETTGSALPNAALGGVEATRLRDVYSARSDAVGANEEAQTDYAVQVNRAAARNEAGENRAGRVVIEGNTVTGDNAIMNQAARSPNLSSYGAYNVSGLGTRAMQPPTTNVARDAAQPQPASADGNRLSSNRTENRSALVVESRDPARQYAVIHRSYLKK